jgi:hypothetical protein
MMAFQQGNQVRGNALMRMAANDGDTRAVRFLANLKSINPQNNDEKRAIHIADAKDK